jgi:hypothetical protein
VAVTSGGSPVAGATVCVSAPDLGIYEVAVTDAAGMAALTVPTDDAGSASVVVTAANALPHSATISISVATGVAADGSLPSGLAQNSPNPFAGSTGIALTLARPGRVSVAVFDVAGRRVATLAEGEHDAGSFNLSWDGRDDSGHEVAAGAYFVRMVGADSHFERKMTLLR